MPASCRKSDSEARAIQRYVGLAVVTLLCCRAPDRKTVSSASIEAIICSGNVECQHNIENNFHFARSQPENSIVGPRASIFCRLAKMAKQGCWFYRRYSRMQPGGKRAVRSQIVFSDRILLRLGTLLSIRSGFMVSSTPVCSRSFTERSFAQAN